MKRRAFLSEHMRSNSHITSNLLEYKFVSDCNARNVFGPIRLNCRFDDITLALIRAGVAIDNEIAKKHLNVDLGLLDGFQLVMNIFRGRSIGGTSLYLRRERTGCNLPHIDGCGSSVVT